MPGIGGVRGVSHGEGRGALEVAGYRLPGAWGGGGYYGGRVPFLGRCGVPGGDYGGTGGVPLPQPTSEPRLGFAGGVPIFEHVRRVNFGAKGVIYGGVPGADYGTDGNPGPKHVKLTVSAGMHGYPRERDWGGGGYYGGRVPLLGRFSGPVFTSKAVEAAGAVALSMVSWVRQRDLIRT